MKKLKILYVPLFIGVLLVSTLMSVSAETLEGYCPETEAQASYKFNVPEDRLDRVDGGGCGWKVIYGNLLDDVFVPREFRIDILDSPSAEGPNVVDGILEATLWMVGAPYPEPNLEVAFSPDSITIDQEVVFSFAGDPLPLIAKYIKWDLGNEVKTLSVPGGTTTANYYSQPGTYYISAEVLNEYNEVLYVISSVEVVVVEEPEAHQIFLPLVINNYSAPQYVSLMSEPLDFCPDPPHETLGGRLHSDGTIGAEEDWLIGAVCSFKPAYPEESYYVTLQPGSELHTISGVKDEPGYYELKEDFTLWVPNWWAI